MRSLGFAAILIGGLAGCSVGEDVVQDSARGAAKRVVTPIVVERFPSRNAAAYSDCILDNATTKEIVSLAKAAVTGVTDATLNSVIGIATRPDTINCILKAELASALG